LAREDTLFGSDGSIIFVRSNNVSRPVVVSVVFRAGKRPRGTSSGRTGDAVGVQSIASSSSSSREERISVSRDCDAGPREGTVSGDGGGGDDDDDEDENDEVGFGKVAGLREGCPKTGPDACHVRSGIGAAVRERLSRSVGGSRAWTRECEAEVVFALVVAVVLAVEK
jgi:hypothetical protein